MIIHYSNAIMLKLTYYFICCMEKYQGFIVMNVTSSLKTLSLDYFSRV